MEKLLDFILKQIVEDGYQIKKDDSENRVLFTIISEKDKMGTIIGKKGRTIKAIQDLLKIKAVLDKKNVFVEVREKE